MPLYVSRIRAICFDVDGTLSDTDDLMVAQLARFLHPFSFLFPKRDLLQTTRRIVMTSEAPANFLIGIPDILGHLHIIKRRCRQRDFSAIDHLTDVMPASADINADPGGMGY